MKISLAKWQENIMCLMKIRLNKQMNY